MKDLCRNDDNRMLRVELYDVRKNIHKLIGTTEFTIKDVGINNKRTYPLFHKKILAGTLEVAKCNFLDRYTFLDYIHGGCDISIMMAMDFTLKNKPPSDKTSLHYDNPVLR